MIPWYTPYFGGKEKAYVAQALDSTWISDGEFVKRLESELREILGTPCAITTSNGTTSLMLAYITLGLKPSDEVILPSFSFAAPANMAIAMGAKPVYVDVDPDTWLMCPNAVDAAISERTKLIVPVHSYGNVCDMEAICKIAKKHGIAVVEDAAEALFSTYRGKQAGTVGDIGSFSFQATKTITTGEGGAICINRGDIEALEVAARLNRSHGMRGKKRYWHEVAGHNFRLTNMQAAMGCAQLEAREDITENKNRVYARYKSHLENQPGVTTQTITSGCAPVMWAIAVALDTEALPTRDIVMETLRKVHGIDTRPGFYAFSDMPAYDAPECLNGKRLSDTVISLPSSTLLSNEDIDRICEALISLRCA